MRERTHTVAQMPRFVSTLLAALLCFACVVGCTPDAPASSPASASAVTLAEVPDYSGEDYIELNGGVPSFTEEELNTPEGTEIYGELDSLGRATGAFAKLCANTRPKPGSTRDTNMPDPSGFEQARYPEIGLDHLYERSHLIAYSLNDEATNPRDLITGTEHLNQSTMTDFETAIRNWISLADEELEQENHVLMRVTPDFRGNELVARGIQIEALSVEDAGESISLNVYCYNIQPGVIIDYATGESRLESEPEVLASIANADEADEAEHAFVLNTNTKRFHLPDCASASKMKPQNRQDVTATRSHLIEEGYQPCGSCHP